MIKVLIADDDPAILRLVKTIVEKEGFEAVTARDGKEAYQFLQSGESFGAAIFDVVMPHLIGTDLVKHMQSNERLSKIPVIIMTAEQNSGMATDSYKAGAIGFLPKPFTPSQIKSMLSMFAKTN